MKPIATAIWIYALIISASAGAVQYQYDAEQRLTRAAYGGQQVDYTYNGAGNILTATTTGSAAKGTVMMRVTPTAAAWVFTDSAGVAHSGVGNQDIANIPLGRVDAFWKPYSTMIPPAFNPSYGVLTGSSITIQGIYTLPQNAARNWALYK